MQRTMVRLAFAAAAAALVPAIAMAQRPQRPVHTYSIVARDSVTGDLGVAVQSHWFSVGSVVPWAEAGVGVVATQSLVEVTYGPLGLELMRAGKSSRQALDALLSSDGGEALRQVAMVDAHGNVAVHTGSRCIPEAGHLTGKQYSVQANLMEKSTVWRAMARAYEVAPGDLAERLLASLEAAQNEGGDIRGKQSAAMIIVRGTSSGKPWEDRVLDLRIEDHPEPVQELRRLVDVHRAYHYMNEGDAQMEKNDIAAALAAYGNAARLLPGNPEVKFWAAITMVGAGREADATPLFRDVFAADPRWRELVTRLPATGLLAADEATVRRIVAIGR